MTKIWIGRTLLIFATVFTGVACLAAQPSDKAADTPVDGASHAVADNGAASVLARVQPLAEQGDPKAQYNMGVIYDRGYGVKRDYAQARRWYEKAAAQGDAEAAHNLGVMYHQGHGVAVDDKQAVIWFRQAAELGEPAAQNNLAVMYAEGMGVQQDLAQAVMWMARAASAGNDSAVNNLSVLAAELPAADVTGNNVNVRAEPSTGAEVLAQADADTTVAVLKTQDKWSRVLLPDFAVGWIANSLLTAQAPEQEQGQAQLSAMADTKADTSMAATDSQDDAVVAQTDTIATAATATDADVADEPAKSADGDATAQADAPAHAVPPATAAGDVFVAGAPDDAATAADVGEPAPAAAGTADAAADSAGASGQPKDATESVVQSTAATKTVGVGTANVRKRPSRQASVLFRLQRGDRVSISKSHNGWDYVEADNGKHGWVADYLLVDG